MNQPIPDRLAFLGADREAAQEARMEIWEERIRVLPTRFGISLDRLPPKFRFEDNLTIPPFLNFGCDYDGARDAWSSGEVALS